MNELVNYCEKEYITKADYVDVKGGRCSFGQMRDMCKVITKEAVEIDKFKSLIKVLHPKWKPIITPSLIRYAEEVVKGVEFWLRQEEDKLKYTPSADEKAARCEEMTKKVGVFNVAATLGEKFGQHPDTVYRWEYGTVFAMLYRDLELHKYTQRLEAVRRRKEKK